MSYYKEFKEFLVYFNNPHINQKYVHIAGTKGKTSTSYYVYEILQTQGYKTGLFVSPHVYTLYERVQYNGEIINEKDYIHYYEMVAGAKKDLGLPLAYFNEWLLIAFLYFRDKKPDFIVLEVGIGGLLDTTNLIDPTIALISRIDKDHISILGKSLKSITKHKLGIIKKSKPFILGKQNVWVRILSFFMLSRYKSQKKELFPYNLKKISSGNQEIFINGQKITLQGPFYMVENFALAFSACIALGIHLDTLTHFTHIVPGRFETINIKNTTLVLDGAHNPIAIKMLLTTLQVSYPNIKWGIILCCKYDKPVKKIVNQLKSKASLFILVDFTEELGENFSPYKLERFLKKRKIFYICSTMKNLQESTQKIPYLLTTGSFYHLHLVKNLLTNKD